MISCRSNKAKPELPQIPQPFQSGDKVWCDYTTSGRYKIYTVDACYKADFVCQSGWLVTTKEGIQTSFKNWKRFYHGIDSDWFRRFHPISGEDARDADA